MKRALRAPGADRDVRRGRALGYAAAGTVLSALAASAVAALSSRSSQRAYDPSAPHLTAKVACTSCHGESTTAGVSSRTCTSCHGPHPSTREAHVRLQESGELRCGTCHPIHRADEGVIFPTSGPPRRFRGGVSEACAPVAFRPDQRAVVPLVGETACQPCHQTGAGNDPAHRCFPPPSSPGGNVDHCFDEHRAALAEPRAAGVCGAQHGAARAFAWEAAADVARTTQPAARGGAGGASALLAVVAGGLGGAAGLVLARRRRSWGSQGGGGLLPDSAGHLASPSSVARRVRLPRIDESRCLGCFACVDACPYDVLAIESYVAKVVREDACCGVVLCQQRCPNGSLVIAEGEVRTDVPRISEDLESELVPGVYLAGDVTGGSLIKNAIRQGTAAIDAKGAYGKSLPLDVLVIGGGPAGIAAALRAKERGLRCVVLEKGSVAESIRSYPRGKLVFDQPLELPAVGKLWLEESTKEELLAQWTRVVRRERIEVREGRTVRSLRRIDGGFEVSSVATDAPEGHEDAETLCASRVIVAVGRRGAARKLAVPVPDDAVSSVFYHLADARSFEGKSVVVVGLGDVAMEAALALAGQAGTTVTLVHRGADFSRGSARNVAAVKALVATAGLSLRLSTEVVAVGAASLTLARGGTDEVLETDAIFVLIGTEPPRALLTRLGLLSGDLPSLPSV